MAILSAEMPHPHFSLRSYLNVIYEIKKTSCPLITTLDARSLEKVWRKSRHLLNVSSYHKMLDLCMHI